MSARRSLGMAVFVALGTAAPARAVDDRDGYTNGIVTESATVPEHNTVRVAGQGGTFGPAEGVSGAISALWSFVPTLELNVQALLETAQESDRITQLSPQFALKWQPLAQGYAGINAALQVRYKMIGWDPNTGELQLWLNVGRKFGRFLVVINAVAGKHLASTRRTDFEAHLEMDYFITRIFSLGLEGRYRTGIDPESYPQFGTAWDVVAGPRAALNFGLVRLQLLVGYSDGRGPTFNTFGLRNPGFAGLLSVSADLH